LVSFVQRATQQGTALLPCFALGRGQEVLRILLDARGAGVIDSDVTFWVDGLIRKILPVYVDRGLVPIDGYETVGADGCTRDMAIGNCQRPGAKAAVITTSGMLNGGPVVAWADALLRDSRHRLALLGYQDERASLGGRLRALRDKRHPPYDVTLPRDDGDEIPLRINGPISDIGLSAHADQNGLVRFAQSVTAPRIALVHGDSRSQERLAARLSFELPGVDVCCPGREMIAIQ
jgi:predicted metal-dependent RNase